jgi:hypothetical protein
MLREAFVANSSSSSFIIAKSKISPEQMDAIFNHMEFTKTRIAALDDDWQDMLEYSSEADYWDVEIKGDLVYIHTLMDNFKMGYFLYLIGIKEEDIIAGEENHIH